AVLRRPRIGTASTRPRANSVRKVRRWRERVVSARRLKHFPLASISDPSLPGLTPQVGFTRLAAHNTAPLGQARVAVQSIFFANAFLRRKMDPRVKPAGDTRVSTR